MVPTSNERKSTVTGSIQVVPKESNLDLYSVRILVSSRWRENLLAHGPLHQSLVFKADGQCSNHCVTTCAVSVTLFAIVAVDLWQHAI